MYVTYVSHSRTKAYMTRAMFGEEIQALLDQKTPCYYKLCNIR